jgi:hypothetical protein
MEAAARLQKEWEVETQEQETAARRVADELVRADAEAARREAERQAAQEREARAERERMQRENRKQREIEASRAEAERRVRQATCSTCMEDLERHDMVLLPCNHWYCGECLSSKIKSISMLKLYHIGEVTNINIASFRHAFSSKVPFACCKTPIAVTLAARWLPPDFISPYNLFILELSTKKPIYCCNRSCSKFIPPQHVTGPIAICPLCEFRTCTACGNAEHRGVCPEDKAGKATLKLAASKGWKQCPNCGFILNRTEGCLHMTCRCRAEWCFTCLRDWQVCNSTCRR